MFKRETTEKTNKFNEFSLNMNELYLLVAFCIVMILIVSMGTRLIYWHMDYKQVLGRQLIDYVGSSIPFLLGIFVILKFKKISLKSLLMSPKSPIAPKFVSVIMVIGFWCIEQAVMQLTYPSYIYVVSLKNQPEESLTVILYIVLLGPIIEEIFFRGILFKGLYNTYGILVSVIASSLLFSVGHIHPSNILSAFIFGVILSLIYLKTKSLGICILCHVLNNSLNRVIRYFVNLYSFWLLRYGLLVFGGMLFVLGLVYLFKYKGYKLSPVDILN